MSRRKKEESAQAANVFQFTLAGLIFFSLALMFGASLAGFKLAAGTRRSLTADTLAVNPKDKSRSVHVGPWGELITRDLQLERPAEYLTDEVASPRPETWTFNGLKSDAVKALLAKDGLTPGQIAAAFTPGILREEKTGTVLVPSADFLLSLPAETRQRLYLALAGQGVNLYLDYPYIFSGGNLESLCADARLDPADVAVMKRLVYANGDARQLADYPALLCQIPTVERRVAMARALSRQSAD